MSSSVIEGVVVFKALMCYAKVPEYRRRSRAYLISPLTGGLVAVSGTYSRTSLDMARGKKASLTLCSSISSICYSDGFYRP